MEGRLQAKLLQLLSSRSNRAHELSAPPPPHPQPPPHNDCHTLHEQNPVQKFDMQMQTAHCFMDNEGSLIRLSFLRTTNKVTRKFRDLIVNMKGRSKIDR